MKFRDIKTFPHCSYRVDVSWVYLEDHINSELGVGLDLNPDFQRGHVWTPDQQIAYCEFVLRNGSSGRELYFNHPNWMGSFRGDYVIIDGKQRLEAVRAFMRGDIPVFGTYIHEYEDNPDILVARFSWNIAKIQTRKEVLEWYLHFNSGGTIHSKEELFKVRCLIEDEEAKLKK